MRRHWPGVRMTTELVVVLGLLFGGTSAQESSTPLPSPNASPVACGFNDRATGKTYDLTPLTTLFTQSAARSQPDSMSFYYYVSPCMVVRGVFGCGRIPDTGVCQRGPTNGAFNIGSLEGATTSALMSGEEGFRVAYGAGFANITSTLDYVCDKAAGVGDLVWTSLANNSAPPYVYAFEWRTAYACPVGGGGGGGRSQDDGWSAGFILLVACLSVAGAVAVYVLVGATVHKARFGRFAWPTLGMWLALLRGDATTSYRTL